MRSRSYTYSGKARFWILKTPLLRHSWLSKWSMYIQYIQLNEVGGHYTHVISWPNSCHRFIRHPQSCLLKCLLNWSLGKPFIVEDIVYEKDHRRSSILFHPCQDLICPFNGNSDVVGQWICMNQRPPVNPGVEDSPVKGFQRGGGGSYVTCLMTFRVICFQECMLLSSCLICITLMGVWENAACMVLPPLLVSWNGPQNSKIRGCQEAVWGGSIVGYLLMEIFLEGHDIGWLWDPGIGICLHGAKCVSLEMTQEARTGWCFFVAGWVGKQSFLLIRPNFVRVFIAHSVLNGLTWALCPAAPRKWSFFIWKDCTNYYFLPFLSFPEFLPRHTGINWCHQKG